MEVVSQVPVCIPIQVAGQPDRSVALFLAGVVKTEGQVDPVVIRADPQGVPQQFDSRVQFFSREVADELFTVIRRLDAQVFDVPVLDGDALRFQVRREGAVLLETEVQRGPVGDIKTRQNEGEQVAGVIGLERETTVFGRRNLLDRFLG